MDCKYFTYIEKWTEKKRRAAEQAAGLCGERKALWRDSDTVHEAGMDVIKVPTMTQDERWNKRYQDVMDFMEKNHRNPSRHRLEEHDMLNWVKQQRKLKNKGELKAERAEMLEKLLDLWEEYKRVNQYVQFTVYCLLFTVND